MADGPGRGRFVRWSEGVWPPRLPFAAVIARTAGNAVLEKVMLLVMRGFLPL